MNRFITIAVILSSILLAIFLMADTGLFVYPFLSNVYFLHIYSLGLLILLFLILLFKNKSKAFYPSIPFFTFFGWGTYITLYSIFGTHTESYFTTYLLIFFLITIALVYMCRNHFLHTQFVLIPVAFAGLIEACVSLLQYFGVLSSHSEFFSVTGTTDNPNIAAMFIALAIPSCLSLSGFVKTYRRYIVIVAGIIFTTSLIVLQCRSALVGVGVIAFVYLIALLRRNTVKISWVNQTLIFVGIIATMAFSFYLHQTKKASADGRLTIWKISGEMITKQPLFGCGYGLFQREYNLQQAEYFNRQQRPQSERTNATFTAMAYNEYLEQTIMGGIPGGFLFVSTLGALLWSGWKRKQESLAPLAGVAAFALMSLINYTIQSPLILFAFVSYATLILVRERSSISDRTYVFPQKLILTFCFFGILFTLFSLQKYTAQKQLTVARNYMQKGDFQHAEEIVDRIEENISSSEFFYYTKARILRHKNQYSSALVAINHALQYTSSVEQILIAAWLSERIGNAATAEQGYKLACGIEPHKFRPRAMLMQLYAHTGQNKKKKELARNILELKAKFATKEIENYKLEARKLLVDATH